MALAEMKKKLNKMREEARSRTRARRDATKDKLKRSKSPTDRRLTEPRSYLSCNNPCGNARDYGDIVEQAVRDIRDRGLDMSANLLDKVPDTSDNTKGTWFFKFLVWEPLMSRMGNQFVIISPHHNVDCIGTASPAAERLVPTLSALTTHELERYERGRYFRRSKAVATRLRHGWQHGNGTISMDSAGWVNVKDLLYAFRDVYNREFQTATVDDLAVIAATGPK